MLRYSSAIIVCLSTLIFIGGCSKPTNESVTKEMMAKMKETVTVLHSVTDESTAKSAADKLKGITEDFKKIAEEAKTLPKMSADEEKKLKDTYGKDMEETMTNYAGERTRIEMNEKLAKPMEAAFKDFDKAFEDLGKDAPK